MYFRKYQNMNVGTKCIKALYKQTNVLYDVFVKIKITIVNHLNR